LTRSTHINLVNFFNSICAIMKKHLLLLTSFLYFTATAQTEADIRKHYQDVNKQIEDSKQQAYEGPLYCNEWVTNKHSKSWPAVGIFTETTSFWYEDDPNHLPGSERDPKTVLLKVAITTRRSSDALSNEEYLYRNGRLLFYFMNWGEEGNAWETRAWFSSNGFMFKSTVKKNGVQYTEKELNSEANKDQKPVSKKILAAAKKYQDLFLKSM